MENTDVLTPLQYPWSWLFIAGSFVVLALGYYVVTNLLLRKKKTLKNVEPLPPTLTNVEKLSLIKNKYAQQVQMVQTQYEAGQISVRKSFQSLSVLLRDFTHEYSKTGAYSMTLAELELTDSPVILQERIRAIYPVAFEKAEAEADVVLAVRDTLEVIQRWH